MNWSDMLTVAVGAGVLTGTYFVARKIYDDWTLRAFQRQTFNAKLVTFRQRSALKALTHVPADERGRGGWMVRPDGTIVNLDTHARFDQRWAVEYLDPVMQRIDHIERMMIAAANMKADPMPMIDAAAPELPPFNWPSHYDYQTMMRRWVKRPSHRNVLLGVTYDEQGNESPIVADMEDLIHVMIGGRSGFGKSNLEYAIARQLVDSVDDCRLAFVDYAGVTLTPLEHSERVLWPTATNDESAMPVLNGIVAELERRKSLYADCPGVQKLSEYNALDDREPLVPWYLFLDETSQCLRNTKLAEMLTIISEQARKFGLGIVGAGTTWHARYAPEPFRVNFSSRAAVYCSRSTSGVVLDGDYAASELERPGQACVMLPGHTGISRILTPQVEFSVIDGDGPLFDIAPTPQQDAKSEIDRKALILNLHNQGQSMRQIEQAVFNYTGGRAHEIVQQTIESATT